jgi:putative inorganic carbon (HCO3(-)) transporter
LTVSRIAGQWPVIFVCLVPLSFPLQQLGVARLPIPLVPLAILAAIGLVATHQLSRRLPVVVGSPLLLALGLVVASSLLSTLVSADPGASVRLDGDYLLGLGLAAATSTAVRGTRAARLLVGFVCLLGAGVCTEGLLTAEPLKVYYGASLVENRATGVFVQPNELGAFAALIVILSIALLLSVGRRHPLRLLAGASLVASVSTLMITLSRGAWLGVVLGLVVLLVLAPTVRRPMLATAGVLVGATASALLVPGAQSLLSILADRAASFVDGERNPYDDRPQIWSEALRQLSAHPVLGVGPGGYPVLATRTPSTVVSVAPDHAHNLILTVAAEQGIVGVLALAAAVGVAVAAIVRTVRRLDARTAPPGPAPGAPADGERVLLAGVAAALAVVLGQGLLDYPLRNAVLATMVWLLLGLLAGLVSPRPVTSPGAQPSRAIARQPVRVPHRDAEPVATSIHPHHPRSSHDG